MSLRVNCEHCGFDLYRFQECDICVVTGKIKCPSCHTVSMFTPDLLIGIGATLHGSDKIDVISDQIPVEEADEDGYATTASLYAKNAIFVWCIVGWIYTGVTWHLLWLPGILIFFPGMFLASLIAGVFFIPMWLLVKRVRQDWEIDRRKRVGLLMFATLLKLGGFAASIVGPIVYVKVLRHFMG